MLSLAIVSLMNVYMNATSTPCLTTDWAGYDSLLQAACTTHKKKQTNYLMEFLHGSKM